MFKLGLKRLKMWSRLGRTHLWYSNLSLLKIQLAWTWLASLGNDAGVGRQIYHILFDFMYQGKFLQFPNILEWAMLIVLRSVYSFILVYLFSWV